MGRDRYFKRSKALTRPKNTRNLRRFLIVCEGTKTEPNYFKKFPDNPDIFDDIDIQGKGYNTLSLVKEAIRLRDDAFKKKAPYIEVWCVFDKDDFPVDQFFEAINLAEQNQIKCAYSIEAFEIWYMLHFHYNESALSREQYKEKLTESLGKPYQKNDTEMYKLLEKHLPTAIQNARRLYYQQYKQPLTEQNPITTVFMLVDRLLP